MAMSKKATRPQSGKVKAGGALAGIASAALSNFAGGGSSKGGSGKRRRHGVEYWSKKVLVEKLKKKYFKTKYGAVR